MGTNEKTYFRVKVPKTIFILFAQKP